MKKYINKRNIIICSVFIIMIIGIIIINKSPNNKLKNTEIKMGDVVNKDLSIIELGELKYHDFLWMIDGAFNNQRYNNQDFIINNKNIEFNNKFNCIYQGDSCLSNNFENEFYNLFASNIKMDLVYGDGLAFKWYEKIGNQYQFKNYNTCDAGRMDLNHTISVIKEEDNKITYNVSFTDNIPSGLYKGINTFNNEFVLIKENGNWKISKAYYHDPCYMEYYIGN